MAEIKFDPPKTTIWFEKTPNPTFMCYCVNCFHSNEDRTNDDGTLIRCTRFSRYVHPLERCEEYIHPDVVANRELLAGLFDNTRKFPSYYYRRTNYEGII